MEQKGWLFGGMFVGMNDMVDAVKDMAMLIVGNGFKVKLEKGGRL